MDKNRKKDGIDEMNICDFPISVLSPDKRMGVQEFKDTITDPDTGEKIERSWTIEGRQRGGLPTINEEIVTLFVLQYAKEQNCKQTREPVTYTTYKLLSDMGWKQGGSGYEFHDMALYRTAGVRITCVNSFYDVHSKRPLNVLTDFGLIQEFSIYGKFAKNHKLLAAYHQDLPFNVVKFTDRILDHLDAYTIGIDLDLLCGLKGPLSKRAYRYLNKNFHNAEIVKDKLKLPRKIKPLCQEHFGMSRTYNLYELKRELDKAGKELYEKGALSDFKYDGEVVLFYRNVIAARSQAVEIINYIELLSHYVAYFTNYRISNRSTIAYLITIYRISNHYLPTTLYNII